MLHQARNMFDGRQAPDLLRRMRARLKALLAEAHDDFPPGTACREWFTPERNRVRNAVGKV